MTSTEFNLTVLIRVYRIAVSDFKKADASTPPAPWRHEAYARVLALTTALEVMTNGLHTAPNPLRLDSPPAPPTMEGLERVLKTNTEIGPVPVS